MKPKSIFATIGLVVIGIIALIILYFAWIGWNERGKPVPDVDVTRTTTN